MRKAGILSSVVVAGMMFSGVASAASYDQYTANNNDTLWLIAEKYGVSLSSLMAANPNVKPYNVYKGLSIKLPQGQEQNWEAKADAVIATGMTQLGVPYVFGGNKPYAALDCSGFVQYAFNQHGYNLLHSSEIISDMGTYVSKDQLRKGDLVFLKDTYKKGVSHVGIYLGNNKMLHAGTAGSRAVKISTLFGNSYYDAHYWGAKRIIN